MCVYILRTTMCTGYVCMEVPCKVVYVAQKRDWLRVSRGNDLKRHTLTRSHTHTLTRSHTRLVLAVPSRPSHQSFCTPQTPRDLVYPPCTRRSKYPIPSLPLPSPNTIACARTGHGVPTCNDLGRVCATRHGEVCPPPRFRYCTVPFGISRLPLPLPQATTVRTRRELVPGQGCPPAGHRAIVPACLATGPCCRWRASHSLLPSLPGTSPGGRLCRIPSPE